MEKFLRNLLQAEKNALHNREMHVSGKFVIEDDPIDQILLHISTYAYSQLFLKLTELSKEMLH